MVRRPCLDCGRVGERARCPACSRLHQQARDARRGSPAQRGLGRQHRKEAAAQIQAVPYCEDCGHIGSTGNPLTGEHGKPRALGGTVVTATLCRRCNSRRGGKINHR